ncbi:DUF1627 domain-containing protein [Sodalis ligni]|uniref:DUF1627 domain-containing protein n=1 Tax=Sodalis ligni TaxID=2697027 RepID=UPI00193F1C30|nr:DUF1627 domain-containing protein [Sodalis ligni]QWA09555.1 DUF1627 domain-containing protein [Sodalis ligni]
METLLDVIGKMEKATTRDIAARMQIDIRPALEMLREHEDLGKICQVNGLWQLPIAEIPVSAPIPLQRIEQVAITANNLITIITREGPQTAESLAQMTGTTARRIASILEVALNRGQVLRRNDNGKFYYCLPEQQPEQPAEAPDIPPGFVELPPIVITAKIPDEQPAGPGESEAEFIDSIPVFVKPSVAIEVPTLRELGKEISRTKNRLARLEKCRAALRVLNNYKSTLAAMAAGPAPSVDAKDGE